MPKDKERDEPKLIPWRMARVCPVSRKPWDEEDNFCWTCKGIHVPRRDHACRTCGAQVKLDGFCTRCREHGGGIGYKLVRRVAVACDDGDCEERKARGGHVHTPPVYERIGESTWLSQAESRAMLRRVMAAIHERDVHEVATAKGPD